MKLSFILSAATLYSMASAVTHYHTQYHYVTVDANGNYVGGDQPSNQGSDSAPSDFNNNNFEVQDMPFQDGAGAPDAGAGAGDFGDDAGAGGFGDSAGGAAPGPGAAPTGSPVNQGAGSGPGSGPANGGAGAPSNASPAAPSSSGSSNSSGSSDGIYAEIQSSGADADFAKEILDAHNTKRALHSADKLSWDAAAYKYAQDYADQYTCGSGLQHSGGKYGENLAVGYNSGTAALEAWYDEVNGYDYSSNSYNHFTQVVWKATTKVGCAYKKCSQGMYVICSYDPAGNVMGQFQENVTPN